MRRLLWGALGIAAAVLVALIGLRARDALTAYADVVSDVDRMRSLDALDAASITRARSDFLALSADIDRFGAATDVPLIAPAIEALPWIGPRYAAARDIVTIGQLAASTGVTLAEFAPVGNLAEPASWVEQLSLHVSELETVARNIREMQTVRARVDTSVLPDNVLRRLDQVDRLLERPELRALTAVDLGSVLNAVGASRPVRYLVLFQNPAELRPTGGFPGTVALITLDRGTLGAVQFFDIHELTQAYLAHRPAPVPQPRPIERFFPQPEFLLHDAAWWPDFPRSAKQLLQMYAESGWPPIDGVIAVQPEVASSLIRVAGPFTIEFDGDRRFITPDNVYDEIERQRRRHLESVAEGTIHKQMLGLIGQTLIERLKNAGRGRLVAALTELSNACDRRDIQAYSADPAVQAELDRQACSGRLQPVDGQPVLAVTYANLALSKTSLDMRPRLTLYVDAPRNGWQAVRLDIDLRDGAVAAEDPIYAGFQRWWVEVSLPAGSTLLSDRGPMEDPDAPNGGSYMAALFPDMTGEINIRFSMPESTTLVVRRQPGVAVGDVVVVTQACRGGVTHTLDRDVMLDLNATCN